MSARQWAWAVAGVVVAVCVAVYALMFPWHLPGFFVVSAVAAAPPLFLRHRPKAFARVCVAMGVGLLAWGLIGALVGLFLFHPAALLLLVAAFVDAANRPGAWWPVGTAVTAAAAVTFVFLPNPHLDPDNEPPPSFSATLDSAGRSRDPEFNQRKERLRDFGATRTEVWEVSGQFQLHVGMPRNFAEGQSREALREQIARLPGVVDVRFCTFHTCGG
ncbi:hypothetical protein ACGFYU_06515 [Streptomyces sp. NPDC048337]|uniref:hypothetical protein n=1 Tax=Streptomyces sp. NPDC048337 TaxID=3365535 RepID=UPI0037176631